MRLNEFEIEGYKFDDEYASLEGGVEYTSIAADEDFVHLVLAQNLSTGKEDVVAQVFSGCQLARTVVFSADTGVKFISESINRIIKEI